MESSIVAATSYLPGKLREAAHAVLRPDEAVLCEFTLGLGSALLLTNMRLIVVQGGLLRTNKLKGTRSASIGITQITDISLEVKKDDENDGAYLRVAAEGVNLPPWVTKLQVEPKALPRAFQMIKLLYSMLGQLSLNSPVGAKLPRPHPACPVCDAPLMSITQNDGA